MKKRILRIVCLMLCLCSLLACFAACKKDEEEANDDTSVTTAGEAGDGFETDENGFVKDTINRTLGGKEVRILMDTSSLNDVMPQEFTSGGNAIQDKAYTRNLNLAMRLECTFKTFTAPGEWANMTEYITVAEKAGDNDIDIICAFSLVPPLLQSRGLLSNLANLEYPQLEMPWWPESVRGWEHNGAIYYVSNTSSNRVIRAQEVVFANTAMINNDPDLEPLEQLVIDGKWTLDVMLDYAKTVTTDTTLPENERVYGLVADDYSRMDQFYYGAGMSMTQVNADGEIELTVFEQSAIDKTLKVIGKLGEIAGTPSFFIDNNNASKLMEKQNAPMFMAGYMNLLLGLPDGSTYIPLPTPKYDAEEQTRYYTTPHNSYDVWCVPFTADNKEDSALVIEAIASSDYREMAPYFYEDKLKMRYSESAQGMQIFDIIRNATHVDFARVAAKDMGIMEGSFRLCFYKGGTSYDEGRYVTDLKPDTPGAKINALNMILTTFKLYKNQ